MYTAECDLNNLNKSIEIRDAKLKRFFNVYIMLYTFYFKLFKIVMQMLLLRIASQIFRQWLKIIIYLSS